MIFAIALLVQEAKTRRRWMLALGELDLVRPLLPGTGAPGVTFRGSLPRRTVVIALVFGATMAIFNPLSTYAIVIGWVVAQRSAWLGAATLAADGLGLTVPLAIAGTAASRRTGSIDVQRFRERLRVGTATAMALAGGFLLSMWGLRVTLTLFF